MPEEDDEMIDMRKAEEETEQECEEPDEAEESTRIKKQKIKDKILEKVKFVAPPDPLMNLIEKFVREPCQIIRLFI